MEQKLKAKLFWLFAGMPLLIGVLQSVAAITGDKIKTWPGIGPIAVWVESSELFLRAGTIFFNSEALVFILFFFMLLAWAAFGLTFSYSVSIPEEKREQIRLLSIGISGILYSIVFYYVYFDVLTLSVPIIQRLAFGAVPWVVVGSLTLSWWVSPSVPVDMPASLEQKVREKRATFTNEYSERIEPALDDLSELAIDRAKVNEVVDSKRGFVEEYQNLENRVGELKEKVANGEQVLAEARQLEEEVYQVEPEDQLETVEDQLRTNLRAYFDERFAAFWDDIESPYNKTYGQNIVNVNDYATIYLPEPAIEYVGDNELFIKNINEFRNEMIRSGVPVQKTVEVMAKIEDHIFGDRGLTDHIEKKEQQFVSVDEEFETQINKIEAEITKHDDAMEALLRDRIIDGNQKSLGLRPIQEERTQAIASLHEATFDDAIKELERAKEEATKVYAIVSSISLAIATAKDGQRYSDLSSEVRENSTAMELLKDPEFQRVFEQSTNQTIEVNQADLRLEFDPSNESIDQEPLDLDEGPETDKDEPEIDDIAVKENVHHHLKRLRTGIEDDLGFVKVNGQSVTMQTEKIDDVYKNEAVYENLERFLKNQSLVENVNVHVDTASNEGHIEWTADPQWDVRRCAQEMVDRYKDTNLVSK